MHPIIAEDNGPFQKTRKEASMKIAIFGASGATGRLLTKRCLAAGHQVTALLRTPETFPLRASSPRHPGKRLRPRRRRPDHRRRRRGPLRAGRKVAAKGRCPRARRPADRRGHAADRASAASSSSAPPEPKPDSLDKQPAWRRWIVEHLVYNTLLKWPVASQRAQYAALSASDLDWTMVMPPMLTNGPGHGTYRVDADALPPQRQPHLPRRRGRLHDAADRQPAVGPQGRLHRLVAVPRNIVPSFAEGGGPALHLAAHHHWKGSSDPLRPL